MTTERLVFKRVVVRVGSNAPAGTMRLAADLARQLQLELLGLFVEDARLLGLAGLPFLREFRTLGGGWHSIDPTRLGNELELSRRLAERAFATAAKELRSACRFEAVSGTEAESFGAVSRSGDLVVVDVPAGAGMEGAHETARLIAQAFGTAAAVLLVPARAVRASGPIAVVARTPDDPAAIVGERIAAALGEELATIDLPNATPGEASAAGDVSVSRAFGVLRERMIVLQHATDRETLPQALVATRRVPVLVVDHGGTAGTGAKDNDTR
jgi:hypothetical protein